MRNRRPPIQLTFDDRRALTRDGRKKRRPGPKAAPHGKVRHRTRADHKHWNPLHVTMRAVNGLPSFRAQSLYKAFERAVRITTKRQRADFRIVEYSIQDNHLHLLVEADDKDALARGMKSFSVRANRLFNAAHGRMRGRVWGDRYDRRDLTSPRQVRNALVYCLANYKKHHHIRTGAPRIDPCSSARWFDGWTAIREHDDGPRPTERPRTVLLRIAWKRHGLIHPGECPAQAPAVRNVRPARSR
jgi:putative transposase